MQAARSHAAAATVPIAHPGPRSADERAVVNGVSTSAGGRGDRRPAGVSSLMRRWLMAQRTLRDLFIDTLRDMYHAEGQLVKALPKMAKAAHNPELKRGFETHLKQTEQHVKRVEQAFQASGEKAKSKTCEAREGL